MTGAWILIFALFGNSNYNPAVTNVPFATKELCEKAGKDAASAMAYSDKVRWICVQSK